VSDVTLVLHVEGPAVLGDLTVTGFVTGTTAAEVGWDFAESLRRRYPEATVTAEVVPVTPLPWEAAEPPAARVVPPIPFEPEDYEDA
jgi:hypothetical protein